MATIQIRTFPDPVLKQKSKRIKLVDSTIKRLSSDMLDTMYHAQGVGLAAPQIGIPLRMIVLGVPGNDEMVLINPEVVRRSGKRLLSEGCLSVPGYIGEVKRSESVTVKGRDLKGREIRIQADGLLAQALEHEIDHINGFLYIDRLESPDKIRKIGPEEHPL